MDKIVVVDYGAGNLFSVANALEALAVPFIVSRDEETVKKSRRLLLPGVGHFGQMMAALDETGLRNSLLRACHSGTPLLGICLGMHALFEGSEEAPGVAGLGLLRGVVRRLPPGSRVPQMGWNLVRFLDGHQDWFTFANSFVAPDGEATWATSEFGETFPSAVRKGNLTATQFHPEKSGAAGLDLLRRWCSDAC